MLKNLLNKIDTIKKHIPNEFVPGLAAAEMITPLIKTPSKIYICRGSDHFYPERFKPIRNHNHPWVKPDGGLWASPEDSDNTWGQWCIDNDFRCDKLHPYWKFSLAENSKIITICNKDDLDALYDLGYKHPLIDDDYTHQMFKEDGWYALDFEQLLADGYDAIEVVINMETYNGLYGWDCDSILILNPNCIMEIK